MLLQTARPAACPPPVQAGKTKLYIPTNLEQVHGKSKSWAFGGAFIRRAGGAQSLHWQAACMGAVWRFELSRKPARLRCPERCACTAPPAAKLH